jgi:hypothetical protein
MRPSHSHTRATLTTCLPLLLFLLHLTDYCSCLGQSAAHSLSTTTVRSSIFNIHTRIPPDQSTALTLRRCRYQHLEPTDATFQENASKSCCHTSDASNPTVGATTPNAATCPNHICLAVWIGTYTKLSFLHKNASLLCYMCRDVFPSVLFRLVANEGEEESLVIPLYQGQHLARWRRRAATTRLGSPGLSRSKGDQTVNLVASSHCLQQECLDGVVTI